VKKNPKTNIGLGLAALGRPEYINLKTDNITDKSKQAFKENAFSVLSEAYKLGIRYFDTAPSYGKGEAFLDEWNNISGHSDVILGTKWGYTYMANWQLEFSDKHEVKEHSLNKLKEQWEVSKKMLPNLKYYQVHSATFESGILENEAVLSFLYKIKKQTGLQIGITTSGENQKDVIATALKIHVNGEDLFDCFQVTYNVFEQSAFSILKFAIAKGKKVIIKEALANGRIFKSDKFQNYLEAYSILNQLSKKHEVGVDAIALRFVIDTLQPTYVLSGAANSNQLKENLKAFNFELSNEDVNELKLLRKSSLDYWLERSSLSWN